MNFKDVLKRVQASEAYASHMKNHPQSFLAHIFYLDDAANKDTCQVGYYDEAKQRMTTFVVSEPSIEMIPDQEVLQDPATPIQALDPTHINHTETEVLIAAQEIVTLNYPRLFPMKQFFIIQNSTLGEIYNVTYLTQTFTSVNIKLAVRDLSVLKHTESHLMRFDKGEETLKEKARDQIVKRAVKTHGGDSGTGGAAAAFKKAQEAHAKATKESTKSGTPE